MLQGTMSVCAKESHMFSAACDALPRPSLANEYFRCSGTDLSCLGRVVL